nr:neoverrucotoxin subunit beta-like [Paramormyrops kingsleyae]
MRNRNQQFDGMGSKGEKEWTHTHMDVTLWSALLGISHCKLENLSVDHSGECRTRPGVQKYSCQLTLDPNTAHKHLSFSEGNRKVTWVWWRKEGSGRYSQENFDDWPVLCRESLTGRCYWEAEWDGDVAEIGVTYKEIRRKGGMDCDHDKLWSLQCRPDEYFLYTKNGGPGTPIQPSGSRRVGVYLDWEAGILSFYRVSSDGLTLLYRISTSFTEPLYPEFVVYQSSDPFEDFESEDSESEDSESEDHIGRSVSWCRLR